MQFPRIVLSIYVLNGLYVVVYMQNLHLDEKFSQRPIVGVEWVEVDVVVKAARNMEAVNGRILYAHLHIHI